MACGACGQTEQAQETKVWTFVNEKGEQKEFRTEIEARAAQVRAGNTGTIK
jgi:hypothetical protein